MPLNTDLFQRNLGSQASSTISHTGTSVGVAASTSTDNDSGALTPGGSPPLIVAFLAIGLFMAAMVAVFGWRRMTYGRGMIAHQPRGGGAGPLRSLEYLGEKPELWDFWTRRPVGNNNELNWEGVIPLSACIKEPLEGTSEANTTHSRIPLQLDHIRQHFCHPTRVRKVAGNNKIETVGSPTLQVAMAIAMPSSRKRERERSHDDPDDKGGHSQATCDDDRRLEYSLGLMDIPWHSVDG